MSKILKKILLVEDDPILGETIVDLLEGETFNVVWAKDGNEALEYTFEKKYDLLLLDVNIPFINGFELLKDLRDSGDKTPSIFITANIDIDSIKKGFDVGADDYLKKPFDFDELIIRINALIKKSFNTYKNILEYGDIIYSIDQKKLTKDSKNINLTPSELGLCEYFLKNIGKPLTIEDLISHTNTDDGSVAVLRVQISKLKKIGFNISNIRSLGYRLEEL